MGYKFSVNTNSCRCADCDFSLCFIANYSMTNRNTLYILSLLWCLEWNDGSYSTPDTRKWTIYCWLSPHYIIIYCHFQSLCIINVWINAEIYIEAFPIIFTSESQFRALVHLKNVLISSNDCKFWTIGNIVTKFAKYVAWKPNLVKNILQ